MPGFLPDIRLTPSVVERVQGRLMGLFGGMRAKGLHASTPAVVYRHFRPHYSTSENPKKRKAKDVPVEALDSSDEEEDTPEPKFKRRKFKRVFKKNYKKRFSKNLVQFRLPPYLKARRKAENIEFRKLKATEPERERLFNEKEDQREKDFYLKKVEKKESERIRILRLGEREALRRRLSDRANEKKKALKTRGYIKDRMIHVRNIKGHVTE
jgi:hypothetical protein